MKKLAFLSLLVGLLLVGLGGIQVLALPPAQATQTFTLASDQEVAVGYNDYTGAKVAYDSTEDHLRFGSYVIPPPDQGNGFWRSYLHFDLSGILASCDTVPQARLYLWVCCPRFEYGPGLNTGIYRVTSGWTEAGLRNTASWTWGTLPAFDSQPEATSFISYTNEWHSWDVTSLVADWISGIDNYGLLVSGVPESQPTQNQQGIGAWTRAGSAPTLGPRLEVTCTRAAPRRRSTPWPRPPGVIPEPSTLILLGGGLATLWGVIRLRARRR